MDLKTSQIAEFNQVPRFNLSGMCPVAPEKQQFLSTAEGF
jgi:hypothetical protein